MNPVIEEAIIICKAEIVVAPKQSNPHHLMCSGHQLLDSNGNCIGAVIAMRVDIFDIIYILY
jgi:hypothetical protein